MKKSLWLGLCLAMTLPAVQSAAQYGEGSAEHLYAKLSEMEQLVTQLSAHIEEQGIAQEQLREQVEKLSKDVNFRFEEMSEKMTEKAPVSLTKKSTPQSDYDAAYGLLKKGKYDAAQTALKDFLATYPENDLAGNAQYWLGETYYVQGQYDEAAVAFGQGLKKYKNSKKGADSLLKMGMSLARLDKKDEACDAFANMQKEFPYASESLKSRVQNEKDRLSCPSL